MLTKPAGCALQVIGAAFLLFGLLSAGGGAPGGCFGAFLLAAAGVLLLWWGRQPAIRQK